MPVVQVAQGAVGSTGLTTVQVPDGFGQPRLLRRPDGIETTIDYALTPTFGVQQAGFSVTATMAGKRQATVYDALGRPNQVFSNQFKAGTLKSGSWYDRFDRPVEQTPSTLIDPAVARGANLSVTRSYDSADRVLTTGVPDPQGQRAMWEQCYAGLTACQRDPRGYTTCTTTDSLRRVVFVSDPNEEVSESCGAVASRYEANVASFPGTRYVHGPFGSVVQIIDNAGHVTRTEPDAFGRIIRQSEPSTGERTFAYDQFGQLTSSGDSNGNRVTFAYDLLGRLVRRTDVRSTDPSAAALATSWTWRRDLQDRLDSTTNADTSTVFSYDQFGRANGATLTIDGEPFSSRIDERDSAGRPTVLVYPASDGGALRIRNVYDPASGALQEVRNADQPAISYWKMVDADPFGQLKTESLGNGLTTTRDYDGRTGQPTGIRTGTLQNESYAYLPFGSLSNYNDTVAGRNVSYGYDKFDRVTSAVGRASPRSRSPTMRRRTSPRPLAIPTTTTSQRIRIASRWVKTYVTSVTHAMSARSTWKQRCSTSGAIGSA